MTPPDDLSEAARAKWDELTGARDGDAHPLDADALAGYCRAWSEEQAALKLLASCPNPFIVSTDGKLSVNPLRSIIEKARAEMLRLRRELRGSEINVGPAEMDERKMRLLVEIRERHLAAADVTPTYFERRQWEDEIEYGPLFSPQVWFECPGDDRERMRWSRCLSALYADDLVTVTKGEGEKYPHVALTPAGEQAIEDARGE